MSLKDLKKEFDALDNFGLIGPSLIWSVFCIYCLLFIYIGALIVACL